MRVVSKIVLLVSLLLFVAIDGAYAQNPNSKPKLAPNVEQLQKIMRVYNNLDKLYVEDVDMKPLVEKAIRSMLLELDPHSTYLTAEEMKSAMEMTRGKFGGIGVAYDVHHDSIVVTNVLPGGPAENVGVRPNDRIVEVDSKSVVDIQRGDVPKLLRGDIGSVVDIGVVRHGVAEMLNFSIKRDNIPLTSVDAAYRVDESVGYIKVNRFGNTTMSEFREAMVKLQGIETLILDLSSNPGGLLSQAIDMADYFLPKGLLVTSTEGRAIPTTEYLSKNNQEFDGRVIVIINEGSASGSEAVAGALQDWDRALIVGRRSYGKGLVQREMPLGDGSAMRLTVARYHTPSGRVIQRQYEAGKRDDYNKAFIDRLRGEEGYVDSLSRDSVSLPEYKTLRRGRVVYGGGGITPDIKVEVDTTRVSQYVVNLVAKGVRDDFMMEYMDANRQRLESEHPTFAKFESDFKLGDEELDRIVDMAKAKGVEYDAEGYKSSRELLRNQISAMIAQRLFTMSEYYQYINIRENELFNRALELARQHDLDFWAE